MREYNAWTNREVRGAKAIKVKSDIYGECMDTCKIVSADYLAGVKKKKISISKTGLKIFVERLTEVEKF